MDGGCFDRRTDGEPLSRLRDAAVPCYGCPFHIVPHTQPATTARTPDAAYAVLWFYLPITSPYIYTFLALLP